MKNKDHKTEGESGSQKNNGGNEERAVEWDTQSRFLYKEASAKFKENCQNKGLNQCTECVSILR